MQTNLPGADHELEFWKGFVKSDRFINGWLPDNIKTPDLRQEVADFFLARPDAAVLDCGSGVVSILRGTVPNDLLFSTDPLSREYSRIFDYPYGCNPPAWFACEDLTHENVFDIVHISNALDHTQDPQKAYLAMHRAIKPGGYLVIQGFVNEGDFENWQGMHRFNIDIVDGMLQVSDNRGWLCAFANNVHTAKKITLETGKEWFIWIQQKPEEV